MKTNWTKGTWHYEKKGAIDSICRKCQNEAWWIKPYWACFNCDLKWDGYFTDKTQTFENNICGVHCCKPSMIKKIRSKDLLELKKFNQYEPK